MKKKNIKKRYGGRGNILDNVEKREGKEKKWRWRKEKKRKKINR